MSATAEKAAKPKVTIIEAIAKAYHDAFADDPKVITLGEDLADPEGGGIAKITKGLSTSFGDDRVRSTPISEQAIMGAAIGASLAGYQPVGENMLRNFNTVATAMIVKPPAQLRLLSGRPTRGPTGRRTKKCLG